MYIIFFFVWIVFNGKITAEIVIFGLAIAALVFAFICKFMDYSIAKEFMLYKKSGMICAYIFLLVAEIVKANIAVVHMILNQKEEMEPVIVKFRTNLRSESARVLLANSITLTPGTITVSLEGDELTVHCLDVSLAEGMEDSDFVKLLEKLEEKEK
uniref:Na+/H+ antiporter subunit E n=1 Tax=Agathobacter sp. TaxID=2021311 RepID=UPI0040568C7E